MDLFTGGGGSGPTAPGPMGPLPPISQTPGMPGLPGAGGPLGPASMPQFTPPPFYGGGSPAGGGGGTPWYLNPQTLGALGSGIGAVWGAYNQNQTNNQNLDAQKAQLAMLNARQGQVTDYVNGFLQPGQNPYSATILSMLGGGATRGGAAGAVPQTVSQQPQIAASGFQVPQSTRFNTMPMPGATDTNPSIPGNPPQLGAAGAQGFNLPGFQAPSQITPGTYNPSGVNLGQFSAGTPGFNAGQDSLMQLMRSGPQLGQANAGVDSIIRGQGNPYDTTGLFNAIDASGQNNLDQQVAQLQGSFGSFGSRLGSAAMNAQGQLRSNYLLGSNLQKQQIGQQAYGDAQSRLMSALGLSSQNALGGYGAQAGVAQGLGGLGMNQLQLLAQLAQGNQSAFNQGGQFNINNSLAAQQSNQAAGQNWNQFQLGALGQANAIQQAQSGQNINLLSLLAGLPMGQAPVAQPNALPGAIGDLSQLALLYPYLQRRS